MELQYKDKSKPLKEREVLYKTEVTDKMMNPVPVEDFDVKKFDPMADDTEEYQFAKRERVAPPKELPTFGMNPKEIREGQMIGMYESKQDLYLTFAHRCNQLQAEIELLKAEIVLLKNN